MLEGEGCQLFLRALIFENGGFYQERDLQASHALFKMSAEKGFPAGMASYAHLLALMGKCDDAILWSEKALSTGDEFASGLCWKNGSGGKSDAIAAHNHFLLASKKGNKFAMYELGCACYFGEGTVQNYETAFRWFQQISDHDCRALHKLGVCFFRGQGIKRDEGEGFQAWKRAAEQEYHLAFSDVAFCFENGRGVKVNLAEAAKYRLRSGDAAAIQSRLQKLQNCPFATDQQRLGELVVYGRYLMSSLSLKLKIPEYCSTAPIRVFRETSAAVNAAVITWLIICKRTCFDQNLKKLVACMLLESKADPFVWKIKLN